MNVKAMTPSYVDTILSDAWQSQQRLEVKIKGWEGGKDRAQSQGRLDRALAELNSLRNQLAKSHADAAPLEEIYRKEQWSRFFLVTNTNGHVHKAMRCSSFRMTTNIVWLPELSGKSANEMVSEFGEKACTICFPEAPTMKEWEEAKAKAKKLEDETVCAGSRRMGVEGKGRQGFVAGNYQTCSVCAEQVGGKGSFVRKHKKK